MKNFFLFILCTICGCSLLSSVDWDKLVQEEIAKEQFKPEILVTNTQPAPSTIFIPLVTNDNFVISKMLTTVQEVATWPQISTLFITRYAGNKFRMDVDNCDRWPRDTSINLICTLQAEDGQWYSSPCDWVKPLPNVKELSSLCVAKGDQRWLIPKKGALVGITLTSKCRHCQLAKEKFRSSTVWLICDWDSGE